jgi:bifunctional non-homologous end joining protein LigD
MSPAQRSRRARLPDHIPPMLAVLSAMPQDETRYSFEFKWDGIRALCFYDGQDLRFESRNLRDITAQYPELQGLRKSLRTPVVLDGEIVALDRHGRPDFSLLQNRMHVRHHKARQAGTFPIQYIIFDLLYHRNENLMPEPYLLRRKQLQELDLESPNWRISPSTRGHGKEIWNIAKKNQLEGIIAKESDSAYEPGHRSGTWLKIKQTKTEELLIGGWVPGRGEITEGVGALLLGYYDKNSKFRYAGKIGTGMSYEERLMLKGWFKTIPLKESPFLDPTGEKNALFCKPQYVVSVEFRGWTPGGKLRQGAHIGIRYDKNPEEVILNPPRTAA